MSHSYPISIIVPIYNVSQYIEQCVISLFEQDFDDIEYIFVNDCTPDNSIEILESIITCYPNRQPHCKILHHEKNKGLGATRKTGLLQAQGEYILHIDSDDWCELDMVSSLYSKAKETGADIIGCDYLFSYPNIERYARQPWSQDKKESFSKLLCGKIAPCLWVNLIKKSLYIENNLYPPTNINLAEDKWLMVRLFLFAKKIDYINRPLLHYRQDNMHALTKEKTDKHKQDLQFYAKNTQAFLKEQEVFEEFKNEFYVGCIVATFIFSKGNKESYKQAIADICPEADHLRYIWKTPYLGILTKIGYSFSVLHLNPITLWLLNINMKLKHQYTVKK